MGNVDDEEVTLDRRDGGSFPEAQECSRHSTGPGVPRHRQPFIVETETSKVRGGAVVAKIGEDEKVIP